jgi:hypothetical protein
MRGKRCDPKGAKASLLSRSRGLTNYITRHRFIPETRIWESFPKFVDFNLTFGAGFEERLADTPQNLATAAIFSLDQ